MPLTRKVGLARGGGTLQKSQLKKVSKAQARANRQQQAAYREVDEGETTGACPTCGKWAHLDHSHVLPQGMNKLLRANPLNIQMECRTCHDLWTFKMPEYARQFPKAIAEKARIMEQLDRQRWALWMMKNGHLLTR